MPTPHNRKPLYYRPSNPGVPEVSAIAGSVYQWDETGSIPVEIQNNKGVMPPAEISGETTIWSDSYTLGYTDSVSAAPMFWSDGGAGDAKVLELINHFAGRLGQPLFSDLVAAKTWAQATSGIYTSWAASSLGSKILYINGANTVSAENVKWIQNPASNYPNAGGSYSIHTNVLSGNSANLTQLSFTTPPMYGSGNTAEWRSFFQALPGKTVRIYNTFNSTTQWADVQINSVINDNTDSAIHNPTSISYNVTLVNDNGWDLLAVYDASYIRVEFYEAVASSPSYSLGDTGSVLLTYIIENNTSRNIMAIMPAGHVGTITQTPSPYVSGPNDTEVTWLPVVPGSSVTITNIVAYDQSAGNGNWVASLQSNFASVASTGLTAYVNGDLSFNGTPYTTNGHTSTIYRPGNNFVQNGDIVRFVYS